jgi:glycosyltransferase involved in cell wall biosynthesis
MVVLSAGFHKTHVTTAAREAFDRELLTVAITGAYPTERVRRLALVARISDRGRIARLLERGEAIPDERLRAFALPELLCEAARPLALVPGDGTFYHRVCAVTWRLYGWLAARELQRAARRARVFHFRAGFGHASIDRARELGMHVLCDHAAVHPALLDELVANRGRSARLDDPVQNPVAQSQSLLPTEQAILDDIDRSDSILVNSDFVKETFLACGWPADRVHVVYLGVDNNFLAGLNGGPRRSAGGALRLLFAGRFERLKGADLLVEALRGLDRVDWELVIAGPVMPEIRASHSQFLSDPRVTMLGTIRRPDLAREMLAAPVFVFPSYAEGSARAVFEALACGCYVITTPNSGTIVEDGVHGALVAPDNVDGLKDAIVAAGADRTRVAEIGARNAALIAARYGQQQYGEALATLYREVTRTRLSRIGAPGAGRSMIPTGGAGSVAADPSAGTT